jgi:hypothetical protein
MFILFWGAVVPLSSSFCSMVFAVTGNLRADRVLTWDDVLDHVEQLGGTSTNAKGATEDVGDSYDPRFAFDRKRERSQGEREQLARDLADKRQQEAADALAQQQLREQQEKDQRLRLLSRSSLGALL